MPDTQRNDVTRITIPRRRLAAPLKDTKKTFLSLLLVAVVAQTTMAAAQQKTPTCADADGDGSSFCTLTPGYKLKTSSPIADPSLLTISNCCERDDSRAAFPACDAAAPLGVGMGGVQAPIEGDTSWTFQDAAGFAQQLDRFTGLCFSIVISRGECEDVADPLAAPKCCTSKPPAALQFKLAAPSAPSVQAGSRRAGALANLAAKCGISWASGSVVSTRGLKRVSRWERVAEGDHAQFFNVPLRFASSGRARQATFCLYTNNAADAGTDCSWESICGLKDGSVPFVYFSEEGDGRSLPNEYAQGCEVRLVGRRSPASSQCCSPPMSLVSFDSDEAADDDDGGSSSRVATASAAAASPADESNPTQLLVRARRPPGGGGGGSSTAKITSVVVLRRGR